MVVLTIFTGKPPICFPLNTPPSIGYTSYVTNMGDMRNSGLNLIYKVY